VTNVYNGSLFLLQNCGNPYKALLQVAGDNARDFAIVMLFLQSGLRVSELVNLKIQDVDFTSREITIRQGKGRKDRGVPLVKQAEAALKAYLRGVSIDAVGRLVHGLLDATARHPDHSC
jgi:site-specific recombinase XerC